MNILIACSIVASILWVQKQVEMVKMQESHDAELKRVVAIIKEAHDKSMGEIEERIKSFRLKTVSLKTNCIENCFKKEFILIAENLEGYAINNKN